MSEERKFSTSLRGYSPEEVDRYLARLAEQVDELEYRNAHLEGDLDRARGELEERAAEVARLRERQETFDERVRALESLIAAVAMLSEAPLGAHPPAEPTAEPPAEPEPAAEAIPAWVIEASAEDSGAPDVEIVSLSNQLDRLLDDLDEGEEPTRGAWDTPPSEPDR